MIVPVKHQAVLSACCKNRYSGRHCPPHCYWHIRSGNECYHSCRRRRSRSGDFPDHTVIRISDHGPGIPDIKLAMQEGWSTAPDYIRQMGFGAGMGLPNMMKCSDKFDIQSKIGEGTSITMEFKHISEDL